MLPLSRWILALALPAALWAQSASPPEYKALAEAAKEKDPQKRVALLQKLLTDLPGGRAIKDAQSQLAAGAKAWPGDRQKLVSLVEEQAKVARGPSVATLYSAFASQLNQAGLFPDLARAWARTAVRKAGTASHFEILGQIELKAGRTGAARGALERALRLDPSLWSAAKSLAAIAGKRGDRRKALDYLAQAFLVRGVSENRKAFEDAWKQAHQGSADDYLDRMYAKRFRSPLHVARLQPAPPGGRTVMIEVHTGAGCGPCAGADLALDAVMERYPRQDVVVAMFHQHIPRPDPMTNADTQARWKFVQGRGVPAYLIDGELDSGGGPRSAAGPAYAKVEPKVARRLRIPPGAKLALKASLDGNVVRARAVVSEAGLPAGDLKLNVALVEKRIRYSGENGVRFHPMVVRSLQTFPAERAEAAFDLGQVAARLKEHIGAFEKKDARHNPDGKFRFAEYRHTVDAGNLAVVAFVENAKSKEVLQAGYFDLAPGKEKRGQ